MEFLRYCKNHFKYKIYKILLYAIITLILLLLFGCKSVNAAEGNISSSINGSDISMPTNMTYYDLPSVNKLETNFASGNYLPYYYTPNATTIANSAGIAVSIKTITPLVSGFYYSITIYDLQGGGSYGALSTISTVGISDGLANSARAALNGDGAYTIYRGIAGMTKICYDANSCQTATAYTFVIYVRYTADSIAFPITSTTTCYDCPHQFYGYSIESLGSKEEGITTQDVQNAINSSNLATAQSVQEVNQGILEVKEELNSVNNSITSESEKFEDSSCGIICKLGKIPGKIIDGLLDGLKSLFIPEDGYFESWFNDLKAFFEKKLGFLATPFTIVIDFINKYLELDSANDIIINIPNITVPNFEDHIIIEKTTLNWSDLLKSKETLNDLWQLYLAFVDVFLILNFIGLCETKYNRIFGGDTSNYEYYTVEDSISYDGQTGEVISQRQNERRTTRKKV